ncbi:hypothetical protein PDY_29330 [Photobacterium damselae subsp. damselae]|nr:hypothetical protein PDY_29330 [Photobacterium damselae subsp. damselae]
MARYPIMPAPTAYLINFTTTSYLEYLFVCKINFQIKMFKTKKTDVVIERFDKTN